MVRPKSLCRSFATNDGEPFYGKPRAAGPQHAVGATTVVDRIAIAVYNATTAFSDPTRADAVAALGEITGPLTLRRIHDRMMENSTGRQILRERPVVTKATIPYERLIAEAPDVIEEDADLTFGQVYGSFLKVHGFDPDERDDVKFVEDETLAYIMLRYRQNHDFFHAITGLPPTVLGELGLKWLELFQTGLPVAALSCTVGSLRLDGNEREILQNSYLPWAMQHRHVVADTQTGNPNNNGADSVRSLLSPAFLMNIYYEKEFDTPINDLRRRLNLTPAPPIHK
eukprot:jgi/Psemu1/212874/e_gw1.617.46.1